MFTTEIVGWVIAEGLIALCGAIFTGVLWLGKSVYKAKKDLDWAHDKIRKAEERIMILEETTYLERE